MVVFIILPLCVLLLCEMPFIMSLLIAYNNHLDIIDNESIVHMYTCRFFLCSCRCFHHHQFYLHVLDKLSIYSKSKVPYQYSNMALQLVINGCGRSHVVVLIITFCYYVSVFHVLAHFNVSPVILIVTNPMFMLRCHC